MGNFDALAVVIARRRRNRWVLPALALCWAVFCLALISLPGLSA